MRKFWRFIYVVAVVYLWAMMGVRKHFRNRLDRVLQERIALKDSVEKYEEVQYDWALSRIYRREHSEKSIEMEVLFEKLKN